MFANMVNHKEDLYTDQDSISFYETVDKLFEDKLIRGSYGVGNEKLYGVGKFVCIYFGWSWASPWQEFDVMLKEWYYAVNQKQREWEVVYVNSDESENDFWDSYSDKPWLAVRFGEETNMKLKALFSIASVPVFVVVNRKGQVVTYSGREDIYELGVDSIERWDR